MKLRDYAMVLEKKLPPPVGRGVAKLALVGAGVGGSSSTQAGEEVTEEYGKQPQLNF